jgi:acyl-CoA thioester hydrolase
MARIKIVPPASYLFSCKIPIRITDINYGGHLGNDRVLSLAHEARMQFLAHFGMTELAFGDRGLIMSDAAIEFRTEGYYGEVLEVSIGIGEHTRVSFELVYHMQKNEGEKAVTVAMAKTGMVCYDYNRKKVAAIPADIAAAWGL